MAQYAILHPKHWSLKDRSGKSWRANPTKITHLTLTKMFYQLLVFTGRPGTYSSICHTSFAIEFSVKRYSIIFSWTLLVGLSSSSKGNSSKTMINYNTTHLQLGSIVTLYCPGQVVFSIPQLIVLNEQPVVQSVLFFQFYFQVYVNKFVVFGCF